MQNNSDGDDVVLAFQSRAKRLQRLHFPGRLKSFFVILVLLFLGEEGRCCMAHVFRSKAEREKLQLVA